MVGPATDKHFPSIADEIAEPHPDMNLKVAAFTVSEKSSNIYIYKFSGIVPANLYYLCLVF